MFSYCNKNSGIMSGMHFLIGCKTDDFVILASDKLTYADGVVVSKEDNKIIKLGEKMYMGCVGKAVNKFHEWTQNNLQLYKESKETELSPSEIHHWLRKSISDCKGPENQWEVDVLLGGFDDKEGKAWLSSIGYKRGDQENKGYYFRGTNGLHNFDIMGSMNISSLYRPSMTREQALAAIKECIRESHEDLQTNLGTFRFVIIDKNGTHQEDISF